MYAIFNALGNSVLVVAFDNGWQCNVEQLRCGHFTIIVVPRYLYEVQDPGKIADWLTANRSSVNNLVYEHLKTDDAIMRVLDNVRSRPTEPHLASQGDTIRQAAKRGARL